MLKKTVFIKRIFWPILLSAIVFGGMATAGAETEGEKIFSPPSERSIPAGSFGDLVRKGEHIFTQTGKYAGHYSGNDLTCESWIYWRVCPAIRGAPMEGIPPPFKRWHSMQAVFPGIPFPASAICFPQE